MIGRILFYLLAFSLFVYTFYNLIKRNDTSYIYLLIAEFIGLLINFIFLVIGKKINIALAIITWIISVIIPLAILVYEKVTKESFSSILVSAKVFLYTITGNTEKVELYLKELSDKGKKIKYVHKKLAKIYEKKEAYDKALEEYQILSELEFDNDLYSFKIAEMLTKLDRNKEAKEIFYSLLKKTPDYYEATLLLGDILLKEEAYKEAAGVYNAALIYREMDYDLWYNLGLTYTMLNDFQKAKQAYERAAEINSMDYNSKYALGQLAIVYGEGEIAESFFKECLSYDELENNAYYYLARISIIRGEIDKAINYANCAIEDDREMFKRIYEDNIFLPIREKIIRPAVSLEVEEEKNNANKIDNKRQIEIIAPEHLFEMCKLVGNLNNSDIEMIANVNRTREEEETRAMEALQQTEINIQNMDKSDELDEQEKEKGK